MYEAVLKEGQQILGDGPHKFWDRPDVVRLSCQWWIHPCSHGKLIKVGNDDPLSSFFVGPFLRKVLSLPFEFAVGVHFDRMSRWQKTRVLENYAGRIQFDNLTREDNNNDKNNSNNDNNNLTREDNNDNNSLTREDFRKTINANWSWLDGKSLIWFFCHMIFLATLF